MTAIRASGPPAAATKAPNTIRRRSLASAPPIANNVPSGGVSACMTTGYGSGEVLRVRPISDGFVERPSHHLTIWIDTCPELDVESSLIEQHAAAVDGGRTSLPGPLQERGVGRIGNHVAH